MARKKKKKGAAGGGDDASAPDGKKVVARNRKARHEYEILDTFEAGIVLRGPEVKSLREGRANLQDAFARVHNDEVWLHNVHISPFPPAGVWNEDPRRTRKLLLHRHQIRRIIGKVQEKGLTLVPLDIYFRRGHARATLAVARGKQKHDKRDALKRREQDREAARAMKDQGKR